MANKYKLTYYTIFNNKGVDMRKLLLVLFLGAILCPLSLLAANNGTLKGRVVLEDKNPASGATLRIVGTNYGAKAKTDGKFTMVGVAVGTIQLKVSYLGAEKTFSFNLSANEIKDLGDIEIRQEKTTEDVVIVADRGVDLTRTSGGSVITSAQLQSNAREGLSSIVGSQAGVQSTGDGYSIRGSRANESSIRLDGVEVSNPLNGGFGSGGTSYFPMPSTLGVSEVQVITGGFSAEYGEAMGGVVNTSMEVGSNEKYRGAMKWRTAVNPLWGSQGSKLGISEQDGILKAFNDGDGYKLNASNSHTFEFAVNGPLPFTDKRGTFAISSMYSISDGKGGYDIKDVLGNSMSGLDNNNSWKKRLDARFKYDLTNSLSLVLGTSFGLSSWESNDLGWSYATGLGQGNTQNLQGSIANNFVGVQENLAKQNVQNTKVMNLLARVKQVFENSSFYIFTLSYNQNNDDNGRRLNMDNPGFLTGFDILEPQDLYTTENAGTQLLSMSGKDMIEDHYKKYLLAGKSKDGYFEADFPIVNPLTGYFEGDESNTTNNPYGYYSSMYAKHSSAGGFQYRRTSYWQADGSYEIMIDDDKFKHAIKTGFEFRTYELHRHYNAVPWSDVSGFDVFTDKWGGNIYIPENYTDAIAKTSKPFEPRRASIYAQDQIAYKGIVFTPGVRVDYFDPNSEFRTRTSTFTRVIDEGFAKADPKIYVSPRIFVTYPLTETSKLDMSYGLFLKTPELQYMYDGFGTWYPNSGMVIGNPDMKAQRSSQYQISYENQLTDELSLSVTTYYKDIYNQLGTIYAMAAPIPFYIYSTSEYGSSKGIEFMLEKLASDNIYANVNYTLASNKGTSPGPASNVGRPVDPYTDKLAFPLAEFAMNNDIRHTLNFTLNFFWLNNEGIELFGTQPLENASINFSGVFSTGTPYTRTKRSGEPISDYNEVRQPSYWRLDLRLKKAFQLADFFGESAGNTSIEFFMDINNLLNRTVATALNSKTADPDDNGTSFYTTVTQMTNIPFYKEVNYVLASTFQSSQYDSYGDRLYAVQGDHNLDGVITRDEQFTSYRNYLKDALSSRGNYQTPRTVYFGILFNF